MLCKIPSVLKPVPVYPTHNAMNAPVLSFPVYDRTTLSC